MLYVQLLCMRSLDVTVYICIMIQQALQLLRINWNFSGIDHDFQ